jgi:hypothetical protein
MVKKLLSVLAITLALGVIAYAAGPLPVTALGTAKPIVINTQPYPVSDGGLFLGTVNTLSTNFWCIDSQLTTPVPGSGLGNVIGLNNISGTNTQYGGINAVSGSPAWTNALGGVFDTAQIRFEMDAYLISQYEATSGGPLGPSSYRAPADTTRNQNIQGAIWAIMYNNSVPDDNLGGKTITSGELAWINAAKTSYTSVDPTKWAAVSWVVTGAGSLSGTPDRQTFLVEVVPEPGFYGALALGLGGLFFFVGRKRVPKA